jgi:undecaprenyl phosphate N,N'-diacetylbacillosamine 1-phosphate transferase
MSMIRMPYAHRGKVVFDFLFSLIALLLVSPICILMIVCLSLYFKGNPFFTQDRPGKGGGVFKLWKFKSMKEIKNGDGELLADHLRVPLLGKIIRATSLDELPQLINVLLGDMSLIGPRPLLVEYLPLYSRNQKRRHEVRPGMTGWAQINGRNSISWEEKFEFDVWYVDHISFTLDMKILWLTFIKVIWPDRIHPDQHITSQKFKGNA